MISISRPISLLLVVTTVALFLGACTKVTDSLGVTGRVGRPVPHPIGPARLKVTVPETGARATLAPVSRNGSVVVWQTLDGVTLAFDQGMLIETRGLGADLMSSDVSGSRAMLDGNQSTTYHPRINSYLDGENKTVFRSFECRLSGRTTEVVKLRWGSEKTKRIEENCVSPDMTFTNIYWRGARGLVLKSRQWISPVEGFLETERVVR